MPVLVFMCAMPFNARRHKDDVLTSNLMKAQCRAQRLAIIHDGTPPYTSMPDFLANRSGLTQSSSIDIHVAAVIWKSKRKVRNLKHCVCR